MSYIGSTPTTQSFIAGTDYFNGTGAAVSFTLSRSVNSVNDIEVIVNNVEQIPSGYSVSGTTLTFSAAPSAGTSNVYVRYLSTTNLSLAIPAGTSATFNTVTATNLTVTNDATINGVKVGEGGGSIATNTAVGAGALAANTTGANQTTIGYQAGFTNTTGGNFSAFGGQAGYTYNSTTENWGSVFVGFRSGQFTTSGNDNAFVGGFSGRNNTTGSYNVSLGASSLYSNTTANDNVAVGFQAAYTNTVGGQNICIGRAAGYAHNTGDGNVFIGYQAGTATTGSFNSTFVGRGAGNAMTGGTKNTIIGAFTGNQGGLDIRTESNYIVLSDGDGNARLYISGGTNPNQLFAPAVYAWTTASAANVVVTGTGGHLVRSTSALKYKTDIRDLESVDISLLRPVRYKSLCNGDDETKDHLGLIADEAATAGFEELVTRGAEGEVEGFQYERLTVVLLKAIQEQQTLITALTTRITALENNNATQ
jgi:hypothetical protein